MIRDKGIEMKMAIQGLWLLAMPMTAMAAGDGVFELGAVVVNATRPQIGEIAREQVSSVVTRDEMRLYNRETVGDAVNLLSGVTVATNSRNEQMVYLRGYDPRQAPLFIDGIPVYVPYDGYVDFGRFSTADLGAIQVAKGFSSVAYGPNTLGGAINLISRKPQKQFEGDASIGIAQENLRRAEVNLGTNQGTWYLQAGAAYRAADGFRMSSDFRPTTTEDGGRRNNSQFKDDRQSIKLGITPGGGDEYALTYVKQNGEKGQPPSTDPTAARYWKWPQWDKESLYFVSRTALGAHEVLKLRAYSDKFDNEVDTYTNDTYSALKTAGAGSVSTGRSIYHDKTLGGAVELESRRFTGQTLRFVVQSRNDRHEERDANNTLNTNFEDTLRSYAAEDAIELTQDTLLSVGVAHHELRPDKVFNAASAYSLPSKKNANNPQIGLFHDFSPTARLYATFAEKTRLPTLKDRYSSRLGQYRENPSLMPEEARNYELGYQGQPWSGAGAEAALFYSDVKDKIQSVFIVPGSTSCTQLPGPRCQMQNVGRARIYGAELGLKTPVGNQWELGGNATFMNLRNMSDPTVKLTAIPENKIVLHALWRPVADVDLVAFMEHDGKRWASDTIQLAGFNTFNLKAAWHPVKDMTAELGVQNLTDKNYELDYGFPNPGRTWFANLNYKF